MENTMSPADMAAMMGNNDGFGNGAWWIIILFLFVFMGGGFGIGRNVNNDQAYTQTQAMSDNNFANVNNQLNAIENRQYEQANNLTKGLSDGFYSTINAVTTEGRAIQNMGYQNAQNAQQNLFALQTQLSDQHAGLAAAIHAEGEATRQLMAAQEAQRLRDELGVARDTISNNQQSAYILQQLGRWVSNPPCYTCGCGCSCQQSI